VIDCAIVISINNEEHNMRRRQFLLIAMVLLVSLLMVSCGIPQEEYDAVLAERNTERTRVESLQTNVDSLQGELYEAQVQITSIENELSELESDLSSAQIQISSLQSDLNDANDDLVAAEAQITKMEAIYKIVLLFDDFEDGDFEGWSLEGDWSVIQEDGNYILRGVGPCSAEAGSQEWTDYTLQARIKFIKSSSVNFRLTAESGMYFLNILPEGPMLYKKILDEAFLARSSVSPEENQWIDLMVKVKGAVIEIYMDDKFLFQYTDILSASGPLLSGAFGFESPENSVLYVDDVIVMVAK